MIKNGRPYTNENGYIDDGLITDISEDEQKIVFNWIKENIEPRKRALSKRTSYGIKHILERDTGIYLTNNQFKDAMMLSGYTPIHANALNWIFKISSNFKAFKRSIY